MLHRINAIYSRIEHLFAPIRDDSSIVLILWIDPSKSCFDDPFGLNGTLSTGHRIIGTSARWCLRVCRRLRSPRLRLLPTRSSQREQQN